MLGAFLRLFIVILVVAGLAILFFYAFIAALIITPILFLLFYLFGRKPAVQWWVMRNPSRGGPQPGPVIDHDPNDLPPPQAD
jgi:hypothetical protein